MAINYINKRLAINCINKRLAINCIVTYQTCFEKIGYSSKICDIYR